MTAPFSNLSRDAGSSTPKEYTKAMSPPNINIGDIAPVATFQLLSDVVSDVSIRDSTVSFTLFIVIDGESRDIANAFEIISVRQRSNTDKSFI